MVKISLVLNAVCLFSYSSEEKEYTIWKKKEKKKKNLFFLNPKHYFVC